MKRILSIVTVMALIFSISACADKVDVGIKISNLEAARTSAYVELDVHDPYDNIVDKSIVVVVYDGQTEVNRKTITETDNVFSIEFTNLAVGKTYNVTVFATYNKKSHVMAKSSFTTSEVGGTVENPKLITSIEEFYAMKLDSNAYYKLTKDLDFNNESYNNMFYSTTFTGHFDGDGHKLTNIKLDQINTYLGIFGFNKGTIKNLNIENVTMTVTKSAQYIGILSGRNTGTIENVEIKDSTIEAAFSRTGQIFVGAVTGLSEETAKFKNVTVSNTTLDVKLTGRTEPFIGLLAGRVQGSQISDSSVQGSIISTVKDMSNIGGMIGAMQNVGNIVAKASNVRSNVEIEIIVDVTSTLSSDPLMAIYLGGIVGSVVGANLTNAYAAGSINLLSASNTSSYNKEDDRIIIGGGVGFNNGTIDELLVSNIVTVGSPTETKFVSFEKLFVGGIVGQQIGNKMTNSMSVNTSLLINIDDNMTASLSAVVGNDFANTNQFEGTIIVFEDKNYDALSVVKTDVSVIEDVALVAFSGTLKDYFKSAYIQAIIDNTFANI